MRLITPDLRDGERADAPAQLHDFTLKQIDRLDIGPSAGLERHSLDGVDVSRHQGGHVEVMVHHRVGDRVHHRKWAQRHVLGVFVHPLAYV